jgi:hypothetical protein
MSEFESQVDMSDLGLVWSHTAQAWVTPWPDRWGWGPPGPIYIYQEGDPVMERPRDAPIPTGVLLARQIRYLRGADAARQRELVERYLSARWTVDWASRTPEP